MVMVVVVSFFDEERYLGVLLDSLAAQTRPPDRLLLVDDGSSDASYEIAGAFAERHPYARVLRRPARAPVRDRLVAAPELRSFVSALDRIDGEYDIVSKMDADLRLTPGLLADMERRFAEDPRLGIAGPYLSVMVEGTGLARERNPSYHARGPAKFYRRECLEQIMPLPYMLAWDSIDEVRARMHGWTTANRYGAHPLHVLLGAINRLRDRPFVLGGVHYLVGWARAAARRVPRAEPEVRTWARREQLLRIRTMVSGRRPT
jgi:biofilm PGA synthesis N-glycosyltransferase PgaC